jgi:excisionase family DNA binding protein
MLTVPEAAIKVGRNPETVRRWIRDGRLRATKIGTQHFIDENDLEIFLRAQYEETPMPAAWRYTAGGAPVPNVVRWIHLSRQGH